MSSRKKSNQNELPLPPVAQSDPKAFEVLRLWMSDTSKCVVLLPTWNRAVDWGMTLVDVARHASLAAAKNGQNPKEFLEKLRLWFDAEWDNPTDTPLDITKDITGR